MSIAYSIEFYTPAGTLFKALTRVPYVQYAGSVNNYGHLQMMLPASFPYDKLALDTRIGIWRSIDGGTPYLDMDTIWLLRKRGKQLTEQGRKYITLTGVSAAEMLWRRWVAYFAGSDYTDKTGKVDDVMKAIVRENLGSLASTPDGASLDPARDYSQWLSVAADASAGPKETKGFSWQQVGAVLQDLAQASVEDGPATFFDVVASSPTNWQFQTFTGQRGTDRTSGSGIVTLSPESKTLTNVNFEEDFENEWNYVYAVGQGEEKSRMKVETSDAARIALSPLNRRERVVQAQGLAETLEQLESEAKTTLRQGRPRRIFTATAVSTPSMQYGSKWKWGDRVNVAYDGFVAPARLDVVQVTLHDNKETITANIRVED